MNGKDLTDKVIDIGKTIWAGFGDVTIDILMFAIVASAIVIVLFAAIALIALLVKGIWWPMAIVAFIAFLGFAYHRGKHPSDW